MSAPGIEHIPDSNGGAGPAPLTIRTRALTRRYGERIGCADVSLEVSRGEVFGLLGSNGAGKSTLVKMLVGLLRPTLGEAWLLGRPLGDQEARGRLGFLPELFRYPEWLTGAEVLDFHADLCGLDRPVRRRRMVDVLDLVGLLGRERQKVRGYSKGMQQRLGLAVALLGDPDLVFLDEPTSALDPLGRREVREIVQHLRQGGKTVFLNSHLLGEVEAVCDRVAFIRAGRVVAQGGLRELLGSPRRVRMRLGRATAAVRLALERAGAVVLKTEAAVAGNGEPERVADGEVWEVDLGSANAAALARAVVEAGADLYELSPVQRTLEDLFVELSR